jgi:uncharacterized protein
MSSLASAVFAGRIVHKRLKPKPHAFAYKVFTLALDLDEIERAAVGLKLFGHNRRAPVGWHDADHGRGDGGSVAAHIRATLRDAGMACAGARIVLVCYPRLLGFVFNPLSVYFCYDRDERLRAVVYEVTNTFGERTSYVIAVANSNAQSVRQVCAKQMYVSPFTSAAAGYLFNVSPPADDLLIGVAVRDADGPVLKTHFRGRRLPLTDRTLAAMLVRHPLMTVKVLGGIHLQAARLWLKGVPIVKHHAAPAYSVAVIPAPQQETRHA